METPQSQSQALCLATYVRFSDDFAPLMLSLSILCLNSLILWNQLKRKTHRLINDDDESDWINISNLSYYHYIPSSSSSPSPSSWLSSSGFSASSPGFYLSANKKATSTHFTGGFFGNLSSDWWNSMEATWTVRLAIPKRTTHFFCNPCHLFLHEIC